MTQPRHTLVRHILGLALALALILGAIWAWQSYPDFIRQEPLRPWRNTLTTWRIPILAMGAFLLLSLLQWIGSKFAKPHE